MISDDLFERLWEPTAHKLKSLRYEGYQDVPGDEELRVVLREVFETLRIPEHIDIDAMYAPINMAKRHDEAQAIRADTANLCTSKGEALYVGPVAEGLQRWIDNHSDPITLFIYQLPMPRPGQFQQDGVWCRGWFWRFATRAGQGWRVLNEEQIRGEHIW